MRFTVNLDECDRSPFCPAQRSCKFGAFKTLPGGPKEGFYIDQEACTNCGRCYSTCAGGAVQRAQ